MIGVVHGTTSKMVHRIEILEPGEDDTHFDHVKTRLPHGKSLHTIPLAALAKHPLTALPDTRLAAIIAASNIGLIPPARCAVIDSTTNRVVDLVMADPSTFTPTGKIVVASPTANIGWSYNPQTQELVAPPFTPIKGGSGG
jgi:hypothetical protein